MTTYVKAPDTVLNIAQKIIAKHHKRRELHKAVIGFLMREGEAPISKGKTVYAKAKKPPPELSAYAELDFIIWISDEEWDKLEADQRKWLIDHELCHLDFTDETPAIRAHDFEEFSEIVKRHGFRNPSLFMAATNFAKAIQKELPHLFTAKKGKVVAVDPGAANQEPAAQPS